MAENAYTMRLEEFEARFRVPVSEQSEIQPVPASMTELDWSDCHLAAGDGGCGAD